MERRHLPLLLGLLSVIAGVLVLTWWRFARHPQEVPAHCESHDCPNIVLVILDDMPWSHFGFLSQGSSVTPQLDELAQEGFVFRNVYNTNSRCRASLATYLTGQLPHQNLIYANQGVLKLHDDQAITRVLGKAGYATFAGGKMWEGNPEQLQLTEYDLDTFHFVRKTQNKLDVFLDHYGNRQPLFVWWAPLLPHKNHNAPKKYFDRIDPASIVIPDAVPKADRETYRHGEHAFLATIAWVDDEIGALRKKLAAKDMLKNTWMVVLADNGWSNVYPAKGAPYDIGVRTPLMVLGPGVHPGDSDALLSTQNLYGSILHLAGLETSGNRQASRNFFELASSTDPVLPAENNVVYWASYPSYTGKSEPDPRAGRDTYALSLRQDNWQYTFYTKSFQDTGDDEDKAPAIIHVGLEQDYNYQAGDEELFDLSKDAFSQHNLVARREYAQERLRFRKQVLEWWKNSGGKGIDSIEACQNKTLKNKTAELCKKYHEIYPDLLPGFQ